LSPPGWALGVAFSPDGGLLATHAAALQLWDARTTELVATLDPDTGMGHTVVFSPDGRRLAASHRYLQQVKLWDVPARRLTRTLKAGHQRQLFGVAFDGKTGRATGAGAGYQPE
jgi:WD40 repeat protein